jgi:hypothetical protein
MIVPGKMVNKKNNFSQALYAARIKFTKTKEGLEAKIIFRFKKKGRQSEVSVDSKYLEGINPNELSWIRYRRQIQSTYHRTNEGTYLSGRYEETHHALNQRLERIFNETLK